MYNLQVRYLSSPEKVKTGWSQCTYIGILVRGKCGTVPDTRELLGGAAVGNCSVHHCCSRAFHLSFSFCWALFHAVTVVSFIRVYFKVWNWWSSYDFPRANFLYNDSSLQTSLEVVAYPCDSTGIRCACTNIMPKKLALEFVFSEKTVFMQPQMLIIYITYKDS